MSGDAAKHAFSGKRGVVRAALAALLLAAGLLGGCAAMEPGERVMEPSYGGDYLSGMDTEVVSIEQHTPAG